MTRCGEENRPHANSDSEAPAQNRQAVPVDTLQMKAQWETDVAAGVPVAIIFLCAVVMVQ